MKNLGLVVITLSFLVGAYLSVLNETEIIWNYFAVVFVVGLAGVVLARMGSRAAATSVDALESNMSTVRSSLDNIVRHVSQLHAEKESIPTYDVSTEIDARVLDDLNDFVAAREAISHTFGLQAYADVMNHYAGGERYLNRVWSASADGYVDEVKAFLGHSLEQFRLAQEKVSALQAENRQEKISGTRGS